MNYTEITPNNIVEAIKIVNELHEALYDKAINFSLYGSTLRNGVGNDIDICVLHCYKNNDYIKKKIATFLLERGYLQFGLDTDRGFLWRREIAGKEQFLDIWIVNHYSGNAYNF
jgi:predicted nucleotidyltransferase